MLLAAVMGCRSSKRRLCYGQVLAPVMPNVVKAGFVIGGSAGSGAMNFTARFIHSRGG
jgi:hypothetical protein